MLKLTFLGTSAGVPTKSRNVTALAVECLNPFDNSAKKKRPWLLIDCGEGTQHQLLQTNLSVHQLAAICITHVHGDHCYGLPGLLASAAMSGRTAPLTLIAPKAIAKFLDALSLTTELYFPFAIEFLALEDLLAQDKTVDLPFSPYHQVTIDINALSHRVASFGFGISQIVTKKMLNKEKLLENGIAPSATWGTLQQGFDVTLENNQILKANDYLITEKIKTKIVVAGDNDTPSLLAKTLADSNLLVHEATYSSNILAKIKAKNLDFDPMHSSALEVGRAAENFGVNNLILTHFSARYQGFDDETSATPNMATIRLDTRQAYQGNLWLAKDFAQYLVDGSKAVDTVEYLGQV